MSLVAAIIPAAGSGSRMGLDHPKQFHLLAGVPILVHTVRAFSTAPSVDKIVVVVPADQVEFTASLMAEYNLADESLEVVAGGIRRQDSVKAGLEILDNSVETVLVHDGARPLVSPELIADCCDAVSRYGAAIAAVPVKDTLKKGGADNCILHTVDRKDLWQAQTPQAARLPLLLDAYKAAGDRDVTDEASLLELAGVEVHLVEGSETNLKITRPDDLLIAEKIMQKNNSPSIRIGHGYDAHKFAKDRELVLGGVTIPFEMGLAGHSDADVLTHALCDALLGALGAGDIGTHFPDSDQQYTNIYSIKLLEEVIHLVKENGFSLSNGDITVVCQKPRLAPFIEEMQRNLAAASLVTKEQINVKATTTEQMGFTGRMEGISCHAVVLLARTETKNE
jgi:2-C-methyl-D-erythritol 4-phosphate cytidylyltransferase / 2-C-methyl-D-erythritol 2,4-cyclodiphosphate synthase